MHIQCAVCPTSMTIPCHSLPFCQLYFCSSLFCFCSVVIRWVKLRWLDMCHGGATCLCLPLTYYCYQTEYSRHTITLTFCLHWRLLLLLCSTSRSSDHAVKVPTQRYGHGQGMERIVLVVITSCCENRAEMRCSENRAYRLTRCGVGAINQSIFCFIYFILFLCFCCFPQANVQKRFNELKRYFTRVLNDPNDTGHIVLNPKLAEVGLLKF